MAEDNKKESTEKSTSVPKRITTGVTLKPQLLRVSTIVKKNSIDSLTATAVMTANLLKPNSRIEPAKFLQMVEQFRIRKIKKTGRR